MEEKADEVEIINVVVSDIQEGNSCPKSTAFKTFRLGINLLANAQIFVIVFVCLAYACRPELTIFKLHIILSVLGYQLFMSQAVMALSQCNGFTVLLKKSKKFYEYLVFHILGLACVVAGTVLNMLKSQPNRTLTIHGGLGLASAAACILSLLMGLIALIVTKCSTNVKVKTGFNIVHVITLLLTLILSAATLCLAFDNADFKLWLSLWFENDVIPAPVLQLMTALFTFFIVVDTVIDQEKAK